jgi:hypothetical protein
MRAPQIPRFAYQNFQPQFISLIYATYYLLLHPSSSLFFSTSFFVFHVILRYSRGFVYLFLFLLFFLSSFGQRYGNKRSGSRERVFRIKSKRTYNETTGHQVLRPAFDFDADCDSSWWVE